MPVQDQVVWAHVNVMVAGKTRQFRRGSLLPNPATDREANLRALLRLGGALRVVEVVREAPLARRGQLGPAAAHDQAGLPAAVAPASPGNGTAGAPQVTEPQVTAPGPEEAPGPVVLGPRPPAHGHKQAWVDYAVTQGMDRDQAEGMTRDHLVQHYHDQD